jgi:hypothetical protein
MVTELNPRMTDQNEKAPLVTKLKEMSDNEKLKSEQKSHLKSDNGIDEKKEEESELKETTAVTEKPDIPEVEKEGNDSKDEKDTKPEEVKETDDVLKQSKVSDEKSSNESVGKKSDDKFASTFEKSADEEKFKPDSNTENVDTSIEHSKGKNSDERNHTGPKLPSLNNDSNKSKAPENSELKKRG